MNTGSFRYSVHLVSGSKVFTVLETASPRRAYLDAEDRIENTVGIGRVFIREFPQGYAPVEGAAVDDPEDDHTVVFSAAKRPDGMWEENFYHGFQEKAWQPELQIPAVA